MQVGIGFIVGLWPVEAGRYPPLAYQTALGINLALQFAAFLWFVRQGNAQSSPRTFLPIPSMRWP